MFFKGFSDHGEPLLALLRNLANRDWVNLASASAFFDNVLVPKMRISGIAQMSETELESWITRCRPQLLEQVASQLNGVGKKARDLLPPPDATALPASSHDERPPTAEGPGEAAEPLYDDLRGEIRRVRGGLHRTDLADHRDV